jgi:hypothetical protein
MKPVLMIHEVDEWVFNFPLHEYTLTFDDGLFTQYKYFDRIKNIDTDKIFFISTGIVATDQTKQSDEFIQCHVAHEKFFRDNDLSHYMNWRQIQEIHNEPDCEIGGHSHMHHRPTGNNIIHDTRKMVEKFESHNIRPTSFCYPYNDENSIYKEVLKRHGFSEFYGANRVDVHDL